MTRLFRILIVLLLSVCGVPACAGRSMHLVLPRSPNQPDETEIVQVELEPAEEQPAPPVQASVVQAPATCEGVSEVCQNGDVKESKTPKLAKDAPPKVGFVSSNFPQQAPAAAIQPTSYERKTPPAQVTISSGEEARPDRAALVNALECVLANQHAKALEHLKIYDRPTQELFLKLLPTMAVLSHKKVSELSRAEIDVLLGHLDALRHQLQPGGDLIIDQACFCAWIKSFGNYAPLPSDHVFLGGDANRLGERVQLYVELRNFRNELRNGFYETRLASAVEISGPKGDQIWRHQFDDQRVPITSRSRLHDYYNNYCFYVPPLPAGNYTLTIQITDETNPQSRRTARKSLPLRVNSLPRP